MLRHFEVDMVRSHTPWNWSGGPRLHRPAVPLINYSTIYEKSELWRVLPITIWTSESGLGTSRKISTSGEPIVVRKRPLFGHVNHIKYVQITWLNDLSPNTNLKQTSANSSTSSFVAHLKETAVIIREKQCSIEFKALFWLPSRPINEEP